MPSVPPIFRAGSRLWPSIVAAGAAVMWTIAFVGFGKAPDRMYAIDAVLLSAFAALLYWRSKKTA
jgi:hypothetical protein